MWFDNWQGIARLVVIGLSAYAALIALLLAGIDLPFPMQQIFFRDHTEEIDGDCSRQREGCPSDK